MAEAPFDYCVITASSDLQARLYADLARARSEAGMYPAGVKFRTYADPPGGRVGSGGGTLLALALLLEEETGKPAVAQDGKLDEIAALAFFGRSRVLILHAGGESRRLPCYVPEGKLFAPLSVVSDSSANLPPVVLDILLSLYTKYPWKPGEVIMACGDIIADFNTDALSRQFERGAICGFGKVASLQQGSRHGVFAFAAGTATGSTALVSDFHQKSPPEVLREKCLAPGHTDQCALDTGIFTMSSEWCLAFLRFAGTAGLGGRCVMANVEASELYFDFFNEVVIASLPGLSAEGYVEKLRGSDLPRSVLESMHTALSGLELRAAMVSDTLFLHFGTLIEYPLASRACTERGLLPCNASGKPRGGEVSCSVQQSGEVLLVNCQPGTVQVSRAPALSEPAEKAGTQAAWVEMCSGFSATLSATGFHMLVGLQGLTLSEPLPPGLCLDGRRIAGLADGQIVAVYSVKDTFKTMTAPGEVVFCGEPLIRWLGARGLDAGDVWDEAEAHSGTSLWTARLFRVCDGLALGGYWDAGRFSKAEFLEAERFSLHQLNTQDSVRERDGQRSAFFEEIRGKARY